MRKKSVWHYVKGVPRQVWEHQANQGSRVRAVGRAMAWQAYKRTVGKPIRHKVYGDVRVWLDPHASSSSNLVYFGPWYEWHETQFVARYLRPGDGFIDGGANIGLYSLLAASIVGPTGCVDAFEPIPATFERLRRNVDLNSLGYVRCHQAALAEMIRTARFEDRWDVSNQESADGAIIVECLPLDDLDGSHALAKLDLEGGELNALRGASRRLKEANPPVWLVEGYDSQLRTLGGSRRELMDVFEDAGYVLGVFDADAGQILVGRAVAERRHNFLALRDPDAVRRRVSTRYLPPTSRPKKRTHGP